VSTTNDMIAQLRAMVQLTQTEVQVARIRVSQARTEAVRRELTENARNAERRTEELTRELQRLGGVADVVSPPEGQLLFCGMSIGHEDPAVGYVRTGRAPLNETVTFVDA